ncbi:hypothetical protein ACHWQZ_G000659 [Mnemiopsis leidyi]
MEDKKELRSLLPNIVDLPKNVPDYPAGTSTKLGKYKQFSDEISDSEVSSCDLEAGDTAKNIEVKRWLKEQEERDEATKQYTQLTRHKIAVPHQFLPVSLQAWK